MNNRRKADISNRRNIKLVCLGVIFTLALLGLMWRVAYIKRVYGEDYERRAIEQESSRWTQETVLTASRGNIYDRNKQSLAISYAVDNVILDIAELVNERKKGEKSDRAKKAVEQTIASLSMYLEIPQAEIEALLATDASGAPVKNTRYHVLKKDVDRKVTAELMASGVKCVHTEEGSRRSYTHDNMLSQVIGFVRGDSSWGLERFYNKELSGVNGKMYRVFDTPEAGAGERDEAIDGYSLITTIDTAIQQYAEEAVLNASEEFPAECVTAIVMNPKTGEVLAMAQYPPFDLNKPEDITRIGGVFKTGLKDERYPQELAALSEEERLNSLNRIWANFNISSSYEPGSIFKPIVIAAALEEGVVSPSSSFFCGGMKEINGKPINCNNRNGHGSQTLTQVVANSCNVGMMEIAAQMGPELFYKYYKDFGYGEKTGIDLPAEADFASVQYSVAQLQNASYIATASFGQGFNATPLQSINGFAALINGGNLMKPYVVSQFIDAKGNVVRENAPTVQRKLISEETSAFMRRALESVMTEGTGRKAAIPGYSIGGKTGTAQQGIRHENPADDEVTLSFVSFLPADDPEVIVLTAIHKPVNYVEYVTTPAHMMQELLLNIIKYKGYLPIDAEQAASIHATEDSVELEDLAGRGTRNATHYLNNLGMDYEIVGSGSTVTSQNPAPGSLVSKDDIIYLYVSAADSPDGGEKLILVPKVTDIPVNQAVEILTRAGLTPIVFGGDPSPAAEPREDETVAPEEEAEETQAPDVSTSIVGEQMPSPDGRVEAGTEIKLKIKQ